MGCGQRKKYKQRGLQVCGRIQKLQQKWNTRTKPNPKAVVSSKACFHIQYSSICLVSRTGGDSRYGDGVRNQTFILSRLLHIICSSKHGYGEWDRAIESPSIFHKLRCGKIGYGEWARTNIGNCRNKNGYGEWDRTCSYLVVA